MSIGYWCLCLCGAVVAVIVLLDLWKEE